MVEKRLEYNSIMKFRSFLVILLLLSSCQPAPRNSDSYDVQFHPDGKLFVGDQLSVEVIPKNRQATEAKQISLSIEGEELATTEFSVSGVGQRDQATFWWAVDTNGWDPGTHVVTFSILPAGPTWDESIVLYPEKQNPYLDDVWESVKTDCCVLHYISGTDAARDIVDLSAMVDAQAVDVETELDSQIKQPIDITLIPKLIGHGGFATDSIYVSYLDSNITGNITAQVIHHEMVHILDSSLGGGGQPPLMVEGMAVYLSHGHYKKENLIIRASNLHGLDAYIPLTELLGNFYGQQHEIGYLEAGALIEYMVDQYGWDAYKEFYREVDITSNDSMSFDVALNQVYGIDIEQLENGFIELLRSQAKDDASQNDLKLTIKLYDSLRLYQQKLNPSTYFATAWLPDGAAMREKGITADFLRSNNGLEDKLVEYLLRTSSRLISENETKYAEWMITFVNVLLAFYP
jgi:hypothetical protein